MRRLRLAVIGCGAVTEHLHLPAISMSTDVEVAALVDPQLDRARQLASRYSVAEVVAAHDQLGQEIDAALVTVPNHLHAPIAVALLERGLHVLIEKPMASGVPECTQMIDAAERNHRVLAVAMVRRLYPSSVYVKNLLATGAIGEVERLELSEGSPYNWPLASDFAFRREKAGGGVLIDTGVHALDLLMWWFGGLEVIGYRDDAEGGVEADCELDLRLPNGAPAKVDLSRTRLLRNSCVIRGSHATLEVGAYFNPVVSIRLNDEAGLELRGQVLPPPGVPVISGGPAILGAFCDQIDEFARATRGEESLTIPGSDGRKMIGFFQRCYSIREPLTGSWFRAPRAPELRR
jgi:predicted dehydrogenase